MPSSVLNCPFGPNQLRWGLGIPTFALWARNRSFAPLADPAGSRAFDQLHEHVITQPAPRWTGSLGAACNQGPAAGSVPRRASSPRRVHSSWRARSMMSETYSASSGSSTPKVRKPFCVISCARIRARTKSARGHCCSYSTTNSAAAVRRAALRGCGLGRGDTLVRRAPPSRAVDSRAGPACGGRSALNCVIRVATKWEGAKRLVLHILGRATGAVRHHHRRSAPCRPPDRLAPGRRDPAFPSSRASTGKGAPRRASVATTYA